MTEQQQIEVDNICYFVQEILKQNICDFKTPADFYNALKVEFSQKSDKYVQYCEVKCLCPNTKYRFRYRYLNLSWCDCSEIDDYVDDIVTC